MRLLALVVVVGLAVGCGSVLNTPDGGGGAACERNGVTYPSGTSVPSGDCNSCFCENGQIICTKTACPVDAGTCAFDATYRYGDTGGLVAYEDVATLTAPVSYRYERTSRITDPASSSCAPAMPPCGVDDLYSPGDITGAIGDTDVQKALAMATPPIYGRDTRPVDGTIFQFVREDGHGFLAGGACGSGGPLPGTCVEVPAGITRLVNALRALDEQQLKDPSCAALR
jgi:hypothetical protein